MDVKGKAILVTGGGSGIGKSTALLLGAKGARLLIADISAELGGATVEEIRAAGGEAAFQQLDARNDAELVAAFRQAESLYGRIDVAFNNAGILTGAPTYPATPAEQWRRVIELNLIAVIRGTQLAVESMRKTGGGVIVNTASVAGLQPWNMDPVYSASKGGVVLFTKSLGNLKQTDNIRVNCVCPTLVETPLLTQATDQGISGLVRITRLKPEDIATAVLRLIEDENLAGAALRVLPGEEPALA